MFQSNSSQKKKGRSACYCGFTSFPTAQSIAKSKTGQQRKQDCLWSDDNRQQRMCLLKSCGSGLNLYFCVGKKKVSSKALHRKMNQNFLFTIHHEVERTATCNFCFRKVSIALCFITAKALAFGLSSSVYVMIDFSRHA